RASVEQAIDACVSVSHPDGLQRAGDLISRLKRALATIYRLITITPPSAASGTRGTWGPR
ncbi:unnamed protein product, partial [Ectocarpus fasciculatus]